MNSLARLASLVVVLMIPCVVKATVKVSVGDGPWMSIRWLPGETPPLSTDSVIISSNVTDVPTGRLGHILVNNVGWLEIGRGTRTIEGISNNGVITIDSLTTIVIAGDLVNTGRIIGGAAISMIADGTVIASTGPLTRVRIEAADGGTISSAGELDVAGLVVVPGAMLHIGVHDLRVRGSISTSRSVVGISATTGVTTVLGHLRGSIEGDVVLGGGGAIGIGRDVPEVSGRLHGVTRVLDLRRARFCTFAGDVFIDSGATLEVDGIGLLAAATVEGLIDVRGELGAVDENYSWRCGGNVVNRGVIRRCVIDITEGQLRVATAGGRWDGTVALRYRAASNSDLTIEGDISLRELTIAPFSSGDSNVVVRADSSVVRIRGPFYSDVERGCRLTTGRCVHLYDSSQGWIDGNVVVEGFWNSTVGGRLGGHNDTVTFITPKRIDRTLDVVGRIVQLSRGKLVVADQLLLPVNATLGAENTVVAGGWIRARDSLTLLRDLRGGGALEIVGPNAMLTASVSLRDSVELRIGSDSNGTAMTLSGQLFAARGFIAAGSTLAYAPGSRADITDVRYRMLIHDGFNLASAAVISGDASIDDAFAGANSDVFAFDGSYVAVDVVEAGRGYWVSFPADMTIEQRGEIVQPGTAVPVRAGWNIIGSPTIAVDVGAIEAVATTIVSGPFDETSVLPVRLEPGRGYWVEVSSDGVLVLN